MWRISKLGIKMRVIFRNATSAPEKLAFVIPAIICSLLYSMHSAAEPGLIFPQGPSDLREMSFSRIDPDVGTPIDSGAVQPAAGTEIWDVSYPNPAGLATQNSFIHKNADNFNTPLLYGSGSASPSGEGYYGTNIQTKYSATFVPTETFEGTISATLSGGDFVSTPSATIALWGWWENSGTKYWGTDSTELEFPADGKVSYHGTFDATQIYTLVVTATGMSDPYIAGMSGSFEFTFSADAPEVVIDILPGDTANKIYPNKGGKFPVAVLSGATFDAAQVDPATVKLGLGEATPANAPIISDVDGLHSDDSTLKFWTADTGIFCNDTEVTLSGETYAGEAFSGSDTIDASDCVDGGCHPY